VVHGGGRCTSGDGCTQQKNQRRVVVDRLPPVLRFEFYEDITSCGLIRDFQPFEDITIAYTTTGGREKEVKYKCEGTIFLVNGNHFIARWKVSRNECVEYVGKYENCAAPLNLPWDFQAITQLLQYKWGFPTQQNSQSSEFQPLSPTEYDMSKNVKA
jgi:hypothetical protein